MLDDVSVVVVESLLTIWFSASDVLKTKSGLPP